MSEYQLTTTDYIIRTSDGAHIPPDPHNADRMAYETWLAEGGVPDPAAPTPPLVMQRDANERIDAGIAASLTVAKDASEALHAISSGFNPQTFAVFLLQMKIMTDAFVAMLQAQATTTTDERPKQDI
jgi:hypothetical protein